MVILCRFGTSFIKLNNRTIYKNTIPKINGSKLCSTQVSRKANDNTFVPFMTMIQNRRAQASRSILVQVQSAKSYNELYSYCSTIGEVKDMLHYSDNSEQMHFIIVEFKNELDVNKILSVSSHIQENQTVPVQSPFLWFRAPKNKLGKLKQNKTAKLLVENGTSVISEENLKTALSHCTSVSAQIQELYMLTKLNDVGQRLRFITAKQIESTVSGLFPNVCAYPFGSSVNGFGKMDCDLDLVLKLTGHKENENSRLIYHCKAGSGSDRNMNQRNMEVLGDFIHLFLPGCSHVRRILQARIPILKYHQQLTNIECDLSMTTMSGVYMSDFLYLMGEIDNRVRPLIFVIRKWAKEVFLTNNSPGKWISNFSLTLLALAFLQRPLHSPPVLPTFNTLVKHAAPSDHFITEDGINCTFLRDITKLKFKKENDKSLESLLFEFFEFYSQFDFENKAICLNEAASISKPEHSALYIVNPLERGLNVSKNVSYDELERFKMEVRNAAWLLESQESSQTYKGLFAIFQNKYNAKYKLNFAASTKHNRLMDVSDLFEGENNESGESHIDFKKKQIEKQVSDIRKKTKENIKALEVTQKQKKSKKI